MKAKGLICSRVGSLEDLEISSLEIPEPSSGELAVEVRYGSVNFPDVLMVKGLYQQRPPLPYAVGAELSGVVTKVGPGVSDFAPGDRIASYAMTGGFSERTIVQAERAIKLPDAIGDAEAAAFLVTYGTSYHALMDRAAIQPGEHLVVLGAAGGVGLAAVELGVLAGAKVIACASTSEKLALCEAYGAEQLINYQEEDLSAALKNLLGRKGADVVYDPVGGDYSEAAFRRLGYGGRHLVIGFTAGNIPKLPLNLPLLKSASLVGAYWGSFCMHYPAQASRNHQQLAQWIASKKLKPHIGKVFSLDESREALRWVDERKALGKILVKVG
ncbi:MAG: NADPH:quinone oxidoreductase family protein [Saprospiraceae bacterium]|nr:NADPH:quinone oxidoreductase family protein [Saprospiraceae bacterium]